MNEPHRAAILRVVPGPTDINANGHIFGGWVLSQMDIAAGIVASRRANGSVATVAIDRMEFLAPIHMRDLISVYAKVELDPKVSFDLHVLGMPPAFVLSQNQTLKLKSDKPGGIGPAGRHLWEPFLHKYTNWCCLRIRTFVSNRSGEPQRKVTLRNGINLTDRPKPRGPRRPGRRPHVPSSNQQCQRADAFSLPVLIRASCDRLKEARCRGGPKWPPPLL